jgi:hypothetical protein
MKEPIAKCLSGAEQIAAFIGENPDRIKHLVENEGLPAWRRTPLGMWRAIDSELSQWLVEQSEKNRRGSKF